ncbi:c-type cytochrome [Bacteroidota bacterium]
MIKLIKLWSLGMLFLLVAFVLVSFGENGNWEVPAEYKTMKNPVAGDKEGLTIAKGLYNKNCASCHGKSGLGDGPKSRTIDEFPGDFSSSEFQSQTDGELFYKTSVGKGDMPKYKGKIEEEDIWLIVHYIRTFKKE